jgi:hypothetical protein
MKHIQNPGDLILGLILAVVFTADILTTQICLSTGIGYEANPIMRAVVENPLSMIFVKGIALVLVMYIVNGFSKKWFGYFGMSVVIGITLGAVINNVLVII